MKILENSTQSLYSHHFIEYIYSLLLFMDFLCSISTKCHFYTLSKNLEKYNNKLLYRSYMPFVLLLLLELKQLLS